MTGHINDARGVPAGDGTPAARRTAAKPRTGIRSPGLLAEYPLIGILMVVLGVAGFLAIMMSLQTNGPLVRQDAAMANAMHEVALRSPAWLRELMIAGYYIGQHVIGAVGVILALYFLINRFWPELAMVVVAWAGEGSMWLYLSAHFDRARPVFETPILHQMTAPSFPSGHSISAVMCYGLLAYLLAPVAKPGLGRSLVIAAGVFLIMLVGVSRFFIGDHYLTDVLAGYALGIAWSGLVYTTAELVARRRRGATPRGGSAVVSATPH